jgi:hypothetical protein
VVGRELADSIVVYDLAHYQTSFFDVDSRIVDFKLIRALFTDLILRELKHNFGLNVRGIVVSQRIDDQLMMVLGIVTVLLLDAQLKRLLNHLICRVVLVDIRHDRVYFVFKKRLNAKSCLI